MGNAAALAIASCSTCGTQLGPALLACPGCHALVHAETLARLASEAASAERASDLSGALARWRQALALVPAGSRQLQQITDQVTRLSGALAPGAKGGGE